MTSTPVCSNWDEIPVEQVRRGVTRQGFGTSDVILVMNEIQPEIEVMPHRHEDFDQIATIVSGRAIYHVGDVAHEVRAGSVLFIPAGTLHYIEPLGDVPIKNLDVFAPMREDYQHLLRWMQDDATDEGDQARSDEDSTN